MDHLIQRLQNTAPTNIYAVQEDGSVGPWMDVTGALLVELVVSEDRLPQQVEAVAAQVAYWGRLAAQAHRVWQIEERDYRRWRSRVVLELLTPPEDEADAKKWKKPTDKACEAGYRARPEYADWCVRLERAEEASRVAEAYREGYKAQKDVLKAFVGRGQDGAATRLYT